MVSFHYNNNSKSSGIYLIFNTQNWKVYIGSTKCFQVRWLQHVKALDAGKHSNKHLQSSWTKWGSDAFEFHVLEHGIPDKQQRLLKEEEWISKHYENNRCYNNSPCAISREGFLDKEQRKRRSPVSVETRKKHSEAMKMVWQRREHKLLVAEKCASAAKEQWQKPDIVKKMKEAMVKGAINRKSVALPETTKNKMAAAARANFQRKLEIEAHQLGLSLCQYLAVPTTIKRLCRNRRKVRNQHTYRNKT